MSYLIDRFLPLRPFSALLLGLAPFVTPLRAQNVLYVKDGDQFRLVRRVDRNTPYADYGNGKLVAVSGFRYALRPVDQFAPVFISVRNMRAHTEGLDLSGSANTVNNRFYFDAEFESVYPLEDVFLVLDLEMESGSRLLFVQEIGRMAPRNPVTMNTFVPLSEAIGSGKFQLHLFCGGAEVFHSEMPFEMIETGMDKIVARQIAGVENAPPKPFVGPAPEYPAKLKRAKIDGQAVIHFKISPKGQILDPEVKSATEPAFGDAALAAARMWRFLPRIVNGTPVATAVNMPFLFSAAPPSARPPAQ